MKIYKININSPKQAVLLNCNIMSVLKAIILQCLYLNCNKKNTSIVTSAPEFKESGVTLLDSN